MDDYRAAQETSRLPIEVTIMIERGRDDEIFFITHLLGIPLHLGQVKYSLYGIKKFNTLVPANRWGKSTFAACRHIHRNFYKKGYQARNPEDFAATFYQTLSIAPHSNMTEPIYVAIRQILTSAMPIRQADGSFINNRCLIGWFLSKERGRNTAPYEIFYTNNTKTEFFSTGEDKGDAFQGSKYGYVSYDECGRSNHLELELTKNIASRVADYPGAQIDLLSTPDTDSDSILYHYEIFQKGMNGEYGWYSQEGSAEENIFLPKDYFKETKKIWAHDPSMLDQVLYGKFVFKGANLFKAEDILASKDDSLNEKTSAGEHNPKTDWRPGRDYIISTDTSIGSDEFSISVLDDTNTEEDLPLVLQSNAAGNSMSPEMHLLRFISIWERFNREGRCKHILETFNGESARFFLDLPRPIQNKTHCFGTWQPIGRKVEGRNPKSVRKAEIIVSLQKALALRKLRFASENAMLIKQLSIYREDDVKIPTDRVISLGLGIWYATDGKPKVDKIEMVPVNW